MYLASTLKTGGHIVNILDIPALKWEYKKILKYLQSNPFDLVGLSCNIFTLREAISMSIIIKKYSPNTYIVIGGASTIYPNQKILAKTSKIDFIIRGDGETPLLELCNALEKGKPLSSIPNLTYRTPQGQIIENTNEVITNLSQIPYPSFDSIDINNYHLHPPYLRKKPFMIISTSRGCPYNCSFCGVKRNYRRRTVDEVINEILYYVKQYKVREIYFCDPSLTTNKKFIIELCRQIISLKLNILWTCKSRIDNINLAVLKYMKSAGCYLIAFGAESADPHILKNVNKGISIEQMRQVIKMCRKTGILSMYYFMVGNSGETERSLRRTEDFIRENIPDFAIFAPVLPLPGTNLYDNTRIRELRLEEKMEKEIFSLGKPDWPIFIPESMSEKQIYYWVNRLQRSAFFNPKYLFYRIISIKSVGEFFNYVKGFVSLLVALLLHTENTPNI